MTTYSTSEKYADTIDCFHLITYHLIEGFDYIIVCNNPENLRKLRDTYLRLYNTYFKNEFYRKDDTIVNIKTGSKVSFEEVRQMSDDMKAYLDAI